MNYLDLTLPSIEENLALDEALLLQAERGESGPVLRLWEMQRPAVVLGMNSRLTEEVSLDACRRDGVSVVRRCSGGGTVVLGPGCQVFSLILPTAGRNPLAVRESMQAVLERIIQELARFALDVQFAGISDLVWQQRKVSGNSQRRLRHYFLHHGTLLYDFDSELAERYLPMPKRTPAYRQGRCHRDFLTNLPLQRSELAECLRRAFGASAHRLDWPESLTQQLVRERYSQADWLRRR